MKSRRQNHKIATTKGQTQSTNRTQHGTPIDNLPSIRSAIPGVIAFKRASHFKTEICA